MQWRSWLDSGAAEVNLKNEDGVTPVELAIETQDDNIIVLLLQHGATTPSNK